MAMHVISYDLTLTARLTMKFEFHRVTTAILYIINHYSIDRGTWLLIPLVGKINLKFEFNRIVDTVYFAYVVAHSSKICDERMSIIHIRTTMVVT